MIKSSGTASDSSYKKAKVTGFLKVKDILINPTLKELNEYGLHFKSESNYKIADDERGKGTIITIWMTVCQDNFQNKDRELVKNLFISHNIYLYDKDKVGQSGKTEFINKYGKFTWGDSIKDVPDFFDKDGIRPAKMGEEELINFIKAWGDVRKGDECMFEDINKIINGNVSELKTLENIWNTHKLKVLVGLHDKGDNIFYHVVYNKAFWRVYTETIAINENAEWIQKPYTVGLKWLLDQEYKNFSRADRISFLPKIWEDKELLSDTPTSDLFDESLEINDSIF